uniref:Uncharacterized protein n=1 Tax=Lactuca sativa TaxID=4236 RepID=A0A9R1VIL3_LACSA|nr:hypothetical protein LSAT_V11C500266910 [Lactuca sativa]
MESLDIILGISNSIEMTIQVEDARDYREYDFKEILARLCRALFDDYRTWIDRIGNHKWERLCSPMVRYNLLTLYSVDSINMLSKDARKLPITMLIDFFGLKVKNIFDLFKMVIERRINKSSVFQVYHIDQNRYEIPRQMKNGIVNLESRSCTCGNWQLFDIPFSYVMEVFKELRSKHYNKWVSSYFTM